MQPYLFLISVGPVQEFIATARRSRDLWFGSQLLSALSRTAALAVVAASDRSALIFPAPAAADDVDSFTGRNVANRILAQLDGQVPATKLGVAIETAVRTKLTELRDSAFRNVIWDQRSPELRSLAEQQVADLLELFWVAVPLGDSYTAARDQLEALMAATKSARTFTPSPVSQFSAIRQPKSSLDGTRESVIPEDRFPGRNERPEAYKPGQRTKADALFRDYRAGRAERLSGIDLLKRHGLATKGEDDFPSTSHFAALPFLFRESMRSSTTIDALTRYVANLEGIGVHVQRLAERFAQNSPLGTYDTSILFEERLAEELDKVDLSEARGYLVDFLEATAEGRRPEPYYVLLLADGDNMGRAIDAQNDIDDHRRLSQSLDAFADGVRQIIEQRHSGALIYSGGDDVMAFLPLHTALEAAHELQVSFREKLSPFQDKEKRAPTLSVGLVVTHHIEPLSDALRLARDAEKAAKAVPGKNALAIIVSKRSGVDRVITGRWGEIIRKAEETVHQPPRTLFERLHTFIDWHREGVIPDGAAYELLQLHSRLSGYSREAPSDEIATAMAENAVAIFKRKRGLRGDAAVDKGLVAIIRSLLGLEPIEDGAPPSLALEDQVSVLALAEELIVAREFARAMGEKPVQQGAS